MYYYGKEGGLIKSLVTVSTLLVSTFWTFIKHETIIFCHFETLRVMLQRQIFFFSFLTASSSTELSRGRVPAQTKDTPYSVGPGLKPDNVLPANTQTQGGETMTSVSAGHIIVNPTQPVGSWRPAQGSNTKSLDKKSRALSTELLCSKWLPPVRGKPRKITKSCLFYILNVNRNNVLVDRTVDTNSLR